MTIRDQSTRTLAEALALGLRGDPTPGYRHTPRTDRQYEALADRILAASPTLARRLDLGTAWDDAVAALPEGYAGPVLYPRLSGLWHATAADTRFAVALRADDLNAEGPTPTDALVALTAALRERQP